MVVCMSVGQTSKTDSKNYFYLAYFLQQKCSKINATFVEIFHLAGPKFQTCYMNNLQKGKLQMKYIPVPWPVHFLFTSRYLYIYGLQQVSSLFINLCIKIK